MVWWHGWTSKNGEKKKKAWRGVLAEFADGKRSFLRLSCSAFYWHVQCSTWCKSNLVISCVVNASIYDSNWRCRTLVFSATILMWRKVLALSLVHGEGVYYQY